MKAKRSSLMPVTVPKTASSVFLRRKALDKHVAHNSKLPASQQWKLVYPDFKEVNNIPGTSNFFTVENIKKALGNHIPILIYFYVE